MKVAVCISGQPRIHQACLDNILEVFSKDRPEDIEVDYFIHTWDCITGSVASDPSILHVSVGKVKSLLEKTFNPKKLTVEQWSDKDSRRLGEPFLSAQYSLCKSLQSWMEYEKESGIRYDWIFYTRFDVLRMDFESPYKTRSVRWLELPETSEDLIMYHVDGCLFDDCVRKWSFGSEKKHFIVGDFSWFCTPAAARLLVNLYSFWCAATEGAMMQWWKSLENFSTNETYWNAESRLAIFCVVAGISDRQTPVYDIGYPIRLNLKDVDLSSELGKEFFSTKIYKELNTWFYSGEDVEEALGVEKYRQLKVEGQGILNFLVKSIYNGKGNLV